MAFNVVNYTISCNSLYNQKMSPKSSSDLGFSVMFPIKLALLHTNISTLPLGRSYSIIQHTASSCSLCTHILSYKVVQKATFFLFSCCLSNLSLSVCEHSASSPFPMCLTSHWMHYAISDLRQLQSP